MLTYEQALAKARTLKPKINGCTEFKGAYAFYDDSDEYTIGGDSPVIILKDTGEALNFAAYAFKHGHEVIGEIAVE